MANEQYRISDLIKRLEEKKKKHGDLFVELLGDGEGNVFSPVGDIISFEGNKKKILTPFATDKETLTIYPM